MSADHGVMRISGPSGRVSETSLTPNLLSAESDRHISDGAYGEISDRRAHYTAVAMGIAEHREGCWRRECSDWARVMAKIDGGETSLDDDARGWNA